MEDIYPTNNQLNAIEKYPVITRDDMLKFLEYTKGYWHDSDWGWKQKQTKKDTIKLELHTGGWSGNESIIYAMQSNFLFWSMNWDMSKRGGHYYFTIKLGNLTS